MSFTSLVAAPQNAGQDRRSSGRRRPDQLMYVNLGAHNGGIVVDISEGGLQFQSVERIMLGDSLPVTFMLTGTVAAIKATAAVVWCNDSGKGGGLKLLDLPKITQHEISAWVSRDEMPAISPDEPPAKSSGRDSFNLLTTEGRVAPPEPVSDEAAMNMARLLVSARGYARPDSEPQPPFRVHEQIQGAAKGQIADEVREEVHEEVHNEVHEEVHNELHEEAAPEIATLAAAETETQTEIPVIADALAEAIAEAAPEIISEPIVPFAELASPIELSEQNAGSAQLAVEATADTPSAPIAAMETPVESLVGEAVVEAAPEPAALPEAAAAEAASDEVTVAEVTAAEIAHGAASEITGAVAEESANETADETRDETTVEAIAEAAAVVESPAEAAVETLVETATETFAASLPENVTETVVAETATLSAEAAPNAEANPDENVHASSDTDILALPPQSAVNATASQAEDIKADIAAPPSPAPLAAAVLAENIAAQIAPTVLYEIVAEVVAGLESKSERAPEIAQPPDAEESATPLADIAANSLEASAPPVPEETLPLSASPISSPSPALSTSPASHFSSSQAQAPATHEGAPPVVFTGGSLPHEIAPTVETARPAEATPTESAPISADAAHRADSEAPAAVAAESFLYAAPQAPPVAQPPVSLSVLAPTAPKASKEASPKPAPAAPPAKDARVPTADVSRKSAKSNKSKRAEKREKREKAVRTIHDSMQGLSLLQRPTPAAVPAAVPSVVLAETRGVHVPGWGAQVLKFAIGVGVGCCLVAGAFVGIVLLGPGHGARIFAGANADNAPETSVGTVAPALDVEVIDLNSRRWHLNDSTPDAVFFASQEPVVELTPADPQLAAGATATTPAPAMPVAKLPVASPLAAKPPVAKLSAAEPPAAKPPVAKSPTKSLVAKSPAPKSVVPQAPDVPVAPPKPAAEPAAPPAPVSAQAAPLVDSPTKSDSPKNLALPNPVATRATGNSADASAPSITESISTSISYPMGNSVAASSAPVDPRTPVSSNTVFPPALLLPPVRHNADFHVASPIRQDNPTYPAEAKRLRVTGTVRMDAFVGKDGKAHSLKVISGDPRLSSASLAAVSNWMFRPAQLDGEAVESEVTISVKFDLH